MAFITLLTIRVSQSPKVNTNREALKTSFEWWRDMHKSCYALRVVNM